MSPERTVFKELEELTTSLEAKVKEAIAAFFEDHPEVYILHADSTGVSAEMGGELINVHNCQDEKLAKCLEILGTLLRRASAATRFSKSRV